MILRPLRLTAQGAIRTADTVLYKGPFMELSAPFAISSRLLPSVTIGGATISIDPKGRSGHRTTWTWYIDLPGGAEFTGDDLSGIGGTRDTMESLLSFLAACGESRNYADRTGREGENSDIFPSEVGEWAAQNSDDISMLAMEIEENPDCVVD